MKLRQSDHETTARILSGQRLRFWQGLTIAAVLVSLAMIGYTQTAYYQYLTGCIAPVEGTWNANSTLMLLRPIAGQDMPNLQAGDALLAVDGQALPPRLNYTRNVYSPLYGRCGQPVEVVLQGNSTSARTVSLVLDYPPNDEMRALAQAGIDGGPRVTFLIVAEVITALGIIATCLWVAWRRRDEMMALLSAITIIMIVSRMPMYDILRYLPPYQVTMHLYLPVSVTFFMLLTMVFPSGKLYPVGFSLAYFWAYVAFMLNRFVMLVPLLNQYYIFIDTTFLVGGVFIQAYRYRKIYTVVQRQQTKWVIAFGGLAISLYQVAQAVSGWVLANNQMPLLIHLLFVVMRVGPLLGFSAILFSILRYRLYNADLVLNRNMVYSGVALVLGTAFLALVALSQVLFPPGTLRNLALAASAFGLTTLFQPLRQTLQSVIDKRFFRLRLDINELEAQRNAQAKRPSSLGRGQFTGKRFGQVEVQDLLGGGGMGEVYFGQVGIQKVAIKFVPAALVNDAVVMGRFEREIDILRQISHPNIVHLMESGKVNDVHYFAMEYIVGQTLSKHLEQQGKLPLDQAKLILRDVATALDYLHSLKIIHRDVKAANIVLQDMRAVLIDFGLAHVEDTFTGTDDQLIGTLDYTAPEQIMSASKVTISADIYALGVLTYRMLTGEMPFKGGVSQLVFAHLNQPAPDLLLLNPNLPPQVSMAVMRALAKDPLERFESAGAFVAELG
jgi:predicted Ser/Thr protein kinase